jgi:hypothetical protein
MITILPRPMTSQGATVYLNQFFAENTLLLEDFDLTGIDFDKWNSLLEKIKILIKDKNITTILIDATLNPVKVDFKYWEMAPTYIEMCKDLSLLAKAYILTGDFTYYYHPRSDVIFFPNFLWIIGAKKIHQYFNYTNTIYNAPFKKSNAVMCLNRNLTWHRLYFFSLIVNKHWFDNIGYAFNNTLGDRLENSHAIKNFLTAEECELIKSYAHLLPVSMEKEKENPYVYNMWRGMWFGGASSIESIVYKNYAINVVTETSLTEGVLLTEKTCKPFMAYQIPIILGPMGANQFLEDIGLDMFSDYIPWKTWDSETDHKLKIRKIVDFLDQLLSSPTAEQDILSTHQSFHTRLINNKEYFHSEELENILLAQIKS